jgi:acetamidase/formamidase
MSTHHTLAPTPATVHWGYLDAKIPPRLTIQPGDTVTIDTVSGGLADVGDTSIMLPHHKEICEKLRPSPGPHILTGPIAIVGAEPGDTLEVRIKAIELTVDWGWNLIRPLRGTLPEDYPQFRCRIIPIDRQGMTAKLSWGPSIPLSPFFGILAVAPRPEYGACSSVEPREFGGNMDNKELLAGTSVYFPVFVPGANFSAGDGHAVQGDGEVCLTALETCLKGTFEFVVHKGMALDPSSCHHPNPSDHHGVGSRSRRRCQAGPTRDDPLARGSEGVELGGGLRVLQPRLRSARHPAC